MMRIAITGPESSGKTSLTNALGEALNGTVFPEFARTFLENLKRNYVQPDLDQMCEGHLAQFDQSENDLQLIDTDFIVLKIWSNVKFGSVSEEIKSAVSSNHFDLHILCTPDIPWEYDPLREHPNQRDELFELYKKELFSSSKLFIIVSGSLEERVKKSCEAIASIQR
jgi:nicotinamide riboside kinase